MQREGDTTPYVFSGLDREFTYIYICLLVTSHSQELRGIHGKDSAHPVTQKNVQNGDVVCLSEKEMGSAERWSWQVLLK
jgi:hypothetical protein